MSESRRRRRSKPMLTGDPVTAAPPKPNPRWWAPVMIGLMLLGLLWIVVWYVSENEYPIPGIDVWNLIIGFGFVLAGFLMTTRWR